MVDVKVIIVAVCYTHSDLHRNSGSLWDFNSMELHYNFQHIALSYSEIYILLLGLLPILKLKLWQIIGPVPFAAAAAAGAVGDDIYI